MGRKMPIEDQTRATKVSHRRTATTSAADEISDGRAASGTLSSLLPPPPDFTSSQRAKKSKTKKQPQQPTNEGNDAVEEEEDGELKDELLGNGVYQMLLSQQKKQVVKKSELCKTLGSKSKYEWKSAVKYLEDALEVVFGFNLIGLKANENGTWDVCPTDSATHFILTSEYKTAYFPAVPMYMIKNISIDNACKLILNSLYIGNRDFDEDFIWKLLQTSGMTSICERREDLRKFLKAELVDTLYCNRIEIKVQDETNYRYAWGIRAEMECDKLDILKHLAKTLKKPIASFIKQIQDLKQDKRYKTRVNEEVLGIRKKEAQKPVIAAAITDNPEAGGESDVDIIMDEETQP